MTKMTAKHTTLGQVRTGDILLTAGRKGHLVTATGVTSDGSAAVEMEIGWLINDGATPVVVGLF